MIFVSFFLPVNKKSEGLWVYSEIICAWFLTVIL
jgi:hypothetical protein